MKPFLLILVVNLVLLVQLAAADDPVVPSGGFSASRYEVLWTKSPFAVATAESNQDTSPDYELVGFANNIDGVSYASIIETQNQEHFLISSDKATRGLTLTSITRSSDGLDTFANVQKDGESITLKLMQAPMQTIPGAPPANQTFNQPGIIPPLITMPGAQSPFTGMRSRPFTRIHRPLIHLPPPPTQPQAASPPPQPPQ